MGVEIATTEILRKKYCEKNDLSKSTNEHRLRIFVRGKNAKV